MAEEDKKKKKRPTAVKRQIQNENRRMQNRMFRAKVRTSIKRFREALAKENQEVKLECYSVLSSLVDKGVNKGIFKKNKASRIKARLSSAMQSKQ